MKAKSAKLFALALLFLFLGLCSPSKRGIIVLCAGDSLTESSYPRHLRQRFAQEGIRAKVVSYGRSGNTTGEYLKFLLDNKETLEEQSPDFICLLLGTNDVRNDSDHTASLQVYENLRSILSIFGQFKNLDGKKSQIFLSTIPPIPDGVPFPFSAESQRRVKEEINPLIKKIGAEENLPVVDNTSVFIDEPGLLPGVHPTDEGYRRLADNWFRTLRASMH